MDAVFDSVNIFFRFNDRREGHGGYRDYGSNSYSSSHSYRDGRGGDYRKYAPYRDYAGQGRSDNVNNNR